MKWVGALILAVLAVAGLVTLFGQGPAMPGLGLTAPAEPEDQAPGYSAEDARLVRTGEDGLPLYRLRARQLDQSAEKRDVVANELTIDYTAPVDASGGPSAGTGPWTLTARRGDLPNGSRRIRLTGDVRLSGKPPGSSLPVRVETQALDFDMEQEIASTKLPTNFYWGSRRLTTRGLTADLKRGTLRLESAVHGRFPP